ncbi:MAG: TIGR00282 family metallophosphoesterase [bacterium]
MRALFIGDVIGKKGRRLVSAITPALRKEKQIDLVIANGENAAGGFGLTKKTADELLSGGVDLLTGGNHTFTKKEVYEIIEEYPIIRPANYPPSVPGRGYIIKNGLCMISLCGRTFMEPLDCPFRTADSIINEVSEKTKVIIVDIHAEATSEKVALGWYLDGRVSAIIGTHTHIPTADARLLPKGTAYITDVGMVGARDSVIGMNKATILKRFLTQIPERFETAKEDGIFCAVILEIDIESGLSLSITPIQIEERQSFSNRSGYTSEV